MVLLGYLRYAVSAGTAFTAYNVTGNFSLGERLKFNGEDTDGRTLLDQTAFETSDVQSVYSIVGSAGTFTADLLPQTSTVIGIAFHFGLVVVFPQLLTLFSVSLES